MARPATAVPTRRRAARLLSSALTVVMALMLVLFVAVTALRLAGGELLAVRTGSMRPGIAPGDLVVTRSVDPRTVRVGDVVTVRVPSAGNAIVTHRVISVDGDEIRTQGDANDEPDAFVTAPDDVLGVRWFDVPDIGYAMVFLASGWGTALLIGVPALVYLATTLADRRAGRRARERLAAVPRGPDDDDDGPRGPRGPDGPDGGDAPFVAPIALPVAAAVAAPVALPVEALPAAARELVAPAGWVLVLPLVVPPGSAAAAPVATDVA